MKIGLLGGSFDPIHKGHIEIASEAMTSLALDSFYFIPTKNNPWKDNQNAPGASRKEMIEIAIHQDPKMKVCTIELDSTSNEKNYTIDTIHALKKMYPDDTLYYLMGMDQAMAFEKWKEAKEISELVQLVAFNRGGYPTTHPNLETYHFIKMNNVEITASSTEIKEGALNMLDEDVLRYISQNGLYLDTMIKNRMKEKRYKHTLSVASLTRDFCESNGIDPLKGYIAGMMHDVAKEMPHDQAKELMKKYYASHLDQPEPIWHQWLSRYVCENEFLINDEEILKAIEDHTTASTSMSLLGMCLYCADKLDPLRGYDSSEQITLCKHDIEAGFRNCLTDFYEFSTKKHRPIDPCFFEVYDKYVKGENND
ncbi:nicotinate-nucleotide adenylyltransferase [uncultured Catenibacterium sp.]|uniref:nicotinate-nucleotide adenylyltransferase n=1 Tax=uncultured Catenibacterium sp. TaxID=286142 RepID=UPI0025EFD4CD|nr:nicotinate-nucleotide adenylyltransferase [uncultured Catenibacterium sp.]